MSFSPFSGFSPFGSGIISGGGGGGSPWSQVIDSSGTSARSTGFSTTEMGYAGRFVASANATIDSVLLNLRRSGTPGAFTYSVGIYADAGGSPGSAVTNGVLAGQLYSDLTTTATDTLFTYTAKPTLVSGSTYWVGVICDQSSGSVFLQVVVNLTGSDYTKRVNTSGVWGDKDLAIIRATLTGKA